MGYLKLTYSTLSAEECLVTKAAMSWVRNEVDKTWSYSTSKYEGGS